jgi:hypothetical protein
MKQLLYIVFFIVALLAAYFWYNQMNDNINTTVNQYQQIYTLGVKHENDFINHN